MKWILFIAAWLLLSFRIALFIGAFIRAGSGTNNMKGGDTNADPAGNQDAD